VTAAAFISTADQPGHDAAILLLVSFLVSFGFIRTSTRMIRAEVSWWPGNIETSSGLHLHHMVWGIGLMLIGGLAGFAITVPSSPWYQLAVVAFGIGAGLTFDEFALWVHLRDVYWSEQGRDSLAAVVVIAVVMALVVLGARPFGIERGESAAIIVSAAALSLVFAIITLFKGRVTLAVAALFVPGAGFWGATRLARPESPWATRRYSARKLARAEARFGPGSASARRQQRFLDLIGGRPSQDEDPPADA
jgi:hypothetical protein